MFRGNSLAKIDEKGRLKLPSVFRSILSDRYGAEVFVTSFFGDCVWIYPMPKWAELEARLSKAPSTDPSIRKFRYRVNYFGQAAIVDSQGRVLIQPLLREQAKMDGEVVVLGTDDHLEIWNHSVFEETLLAQPVTPEDLEVLSQHGI